MKRIISEKYLVNKIPVITFFEEKKLDLPLVFLSHGFQSKKEIHTDMAWNLAERGFFVVILDAMHHGERGDEEFFSLIEENKKEKLLSIVHSTMKDIKILIEHFSKLSLINSSQIGISGNSMGGVLSCYAGSVIDEISTIVSAVGSPSWINLGNYLKNTDTSYINILNYDLDFLQNNDPEKNIIRFKDKKIFLLTGKNDDVVPGIFSKEFYEKIEASEVKCDIIYKEYSVNHRVTPEMKEDIYNWLCEKMK